MNYLTRPLSTQGTEVSDQLPLQVDDVTQASDRTTITTETVTFDCATAASSRGVVALDKSPVLNLAGDKVGSYWDEQKNIVYTVNKTQNVGTLTETAGSAAVVITDQDKNLDQFFDTPAATLRYILKAIDSGGNVLYGYVGAVATSGSQFTIDIYSEAAMSNQDWVGTLASFDNSDVARIEIYRNSTSLLWTTGTVLLKEVAMVETMTEEEIFNNLSTAGDYALNYRTGALYYRKATTGTSDTVTYNTMAASTVPQGSSTDATHDSAVQSSGPQIMIEAKDFDGSALPNSVAEGDAERPAGTLNGVLYNFPVSEDGSWTPLDTASQSAKGLEVAPIYTHNLGDTPAALTNITADTTAYLYLDMAGYKYFALQCETSGTTPTDTLTLTVEASWQDDGTAQASAAYQDVTNEWFGVASVVDADTVFDKDTPTTAKFVRLKYVTSDTAGDDADLTVYARRSY